MCNTIQGKSIHSCNIYIYVYITLVFICSLSVILFRRLCVQFPQFYLAPELLSILSPLL